MLVYWQSPGVFQTRLAATALPVGCTGSRLPVVKVFSELDQFKSQFAVWPVSQAARPYQACTMAHEDAVPNLASDRAQQRVRVRYASNRSGC